MIVSIALAAVGSSVLAYQAVALSVFVSGAIAARFQLISAAVTSATIVITVFTSPIAALPLAVGGGLVLGPLIATISTRSSAPDSGPGVAVSARSLVRHSLPTYGSSLLSAGPLPPRR